MDPVIDEMEHKRKELTQQASAVQVQINELNTKISSKKMQIQNFKNQGNNIAVNSVEQSMKLLYIEVGEKEKMLRFLNYKLNNLQKAEVNEVKEEAKVEKESVRSSNKYVAGAMSAHGHLKNVQGHMKGKGFNILFILLVIFSIYVDIFSISGTPFGVMNISILGAIPVFIIIQIFLIMWFLIDSKNYGDFVLLSAFFALKYIMPNMVQVPFENFVKYIPILIILCILKYSSVEGTSVNLKSIMWTGVLFAVFVILVSLMPMVTSLPSNWGIGTASASSDGMTDDGSTASVSTSTSSAISGISDFWCAIAPLFCDTAAETSDDDGTGDGSTSDGTVNSVDLALAVPLKTITESSGDNPKESVVFKWIISNDGKKPIDTVLFLMDGSQIQDNHSGNIYDLDQNYNSFSDKIEYPGIDISDDLFFKQLNSIAVGSYESIDIDFASPQCSFTQFKAPVYLLYTYEVDSNIMLTLGSQAWWDNLNEQGIAPKLNPTKSVSTVGPFTISIYPDMEQPVRLDKDEYFKVYVEISKDSRGRAAISSFNLDVSSMLEPKDLGGTRCSFVEGSAIPSSNLDSYVLKDSLFEKINTADLRLNNGLNKKMTYKCSFKYNSDNFDKDLSGGSVQRYIGVHMDYTYIYDGLFTLNTGNFTDIDSC